MLKRTLLFENKVSISTKYQQQCIKTDTRETSIPIEDIGFVVVDHAEAYISMNAMNMLIEHNAALIICGKNHLPNGLFMNLNSHHTQQEVFRNQNEASLPLKNNSGSKR